MKKTTKTTASNTNNSSSGGGFDASRDEVIKDLGTVPGVSERAGSISVRVCCYDGGPRKLALSRTGEGQNGPWFSAKLGRLTLGEYEALMPLLVKAKPYLDGTKKAAKKEGK